MDLTFWGVRGSIPTPGADTVYFGGNTSCLELQSDGEPTIILDAGTGIRNLGLHLLKNYPERKEIHLFFSHTHWDHIQGLPFFAPLFIPGYTIDIYGPVHYEKSLEEILDRQMEYTYFPVRVAELQAKITYHDLKEEKFEVGGYKATSKYLNHPVLCLGYRFEKDGKSIAYCTDHEPYRNYLGDEGDEANEMAEIVAEQNQHLEEFVQGVDLLVMDSQYTADEYKRHIGWGHSTTERTVQLAKKAGVKKLAAFHHDPDRTDEMQKEIIADMQRMMGDDSELKEVFGAQEKKTVKI